MKPDRRGVLGGTLRAGLGLAFLSMAGSMALTSAASAAAVGEVSLPDATTVGGQPLALLGAGKRRRFVFDVYVGALYLPVAEKPGATASSILAGVGPRRVSLVFLRDLENSQLTEALDEGIRKNSSAAEIAALAEGLGQLTRLLKSLGALRKGEQLDLDLTPDQAQLTRAGKPVGTASAKGLGRALLTVWLGDQPADEALKSAMLGIAS